jgi:hypothetical protein
LLIYFYQFIHPPTDLLSSIFIAKLAWPNLIWLTQINYC